MIIEVKVQPKSSQIRLDKLRDAKYKAYLNAAPENNKANEELIKLLARELGVKKYQIEIIKGLTSRVKTIKLDIGKE